MVYAICPIATCDRCIGHRGCNAPSMTQDNNNDDLLKRIQALEKLADHQGWIMLPDGTWLHRREVEERARLEHICAGCGHKETHCECEFCMRCGGKSCKGDCA